MLMFAGKVCASLNGTAVDEVCEPCVSKEGPATVAVAVLSGTEVATATPPVDAAAAAEARPLGDTAVDVDTRGACAAFASPPVGRLDSVSSREGERRERSVASFSAWSTLPPVMFRRAESLVIAALSLSVVAVVEDAAGCDDAVVVVVGFPVVVVVVVGLVVDMVSW